MRSNGKPDIQRYGATTIERENCPVYPVHVRSWRTSSHVQTMYVVMGWMAYCGNPAIFAYTDHMVDSFRNSNTPTEQLSTSGVQYN